MIFNVKNTNRDSSLHSIYEFFFILSLRVCLMLTFTFYFIIKTKVFLSQISEDFRAALFNICGRSTNTVNLLSTLLAALLNSTSFSLIKDKSVKQVNENRLLSKSDIRANYLFNQLIRAWH